MHSASIKVGWPPDPRLNVDSIFVHARLKVYNARVHTHNLSVQWETWVKHHANVIAGIEPKRPNLTYNLVNIPIPAQCVLALGDAIHNIRATLDYLISALARAANLSDASASFPMNEKRARVEAALAPLKPSNKSKKEATTRKLLGHYPDLEHIIVDVIRPYHIDDGGSAIGDLLYRIGNADNIDKHRLLAPSVSVAHAQEATFITPTGGTIRMTGFRLIGGPAFDFGDAKPHPENDIAFDMCFSEPTLLADRPMMSTLIEACEAADKVIEIFEANFEGK